MPTERLLWLITMTSHHSERDEMTQADLHKKFKELERKWKAEKLDAHKSRPTCIHTQFNDAVELVGAEIRSDAGIIFRWPANYRSNLGHSLVGRFTNGISVGADKKGVKDWRFDGMGSMDV